MNLPGLNCPHMERCTSYSYSGDTQKIPPFFQLILCQQTRFSRSNLELFVGVWSIVKLKMGYTFLVHFGNLYLPHKSRRNVTCFRNQMSRSRILIILNYS